ncbi:MAG: hypothetical protein RLZZ01_2286 [Actinomycetota bacterium]
MGITTGLTTDSPIVVAPRRTVALDPDIAHRIATDRSGDVARTAAWTAMVAGDRSAIRTISMAYLASTTNAPASISRARWMLMGAAAHTDLVDVTTVADLATYCDAMSDGLVLVQMATMDFGARKPGTLESPAAQARDRIATARSAIDQLCTPGRATPWEVVRSFSFFGDLHLSSAVANALLATGDDGNGEIVRAAHIRRIHHHPEMTVEIADRILAEHLHPWALNTKAASLGDLGKFEAAAELALVSLAVRPNEYSGNVGRRAFRNIGRDDLSGMADRISVADVNRTVPENFPDRSTARHTNYLRVLAADLLTTAGRRDLAELPIGKLNAAPFARIAREAIDIGSSAVEAIETLTTLEGSQR